MPRCVPLVLCSIGGREIFSVPSCPCAHSEPASNRPGPCWPLLYASAAGCGQHGAGLLPCFLLPSGFGAACALPCHSELQECFLVLTFPWEKLLVETVYAYCACSRVCLLSGEMRHQEWAAPSSAGVMLEGGWASGRSGLMAAGPSLQLGSGAATDYVGILHVTSWHPPALMFSCWHRLCLKEAVQKVEIVLVQN